VSLHALLLLQNTPTNRFIVDFISVALDFWFVAVFDFSASIAVGAKVFSGGAHVSKNQKFQECLAVKQFVKSPLS
jgi:hypothetical protein